LVRDRDDDHRGFADSGCFRAAAGTSIDAYNAFVAKNGLKAEVVDLSDNTRGAWLGDKSADTIILWLHGMLDGGIPVFWTVTDVRNAQQAAATPSPWVPATCSLSTN
jgi:hypothetical protein